MLEGVLAPAWIGTYVALDRPMVKGKGSMTTFRLSDAGAAQAQL